MSPTGFIIYRSSFIVHGASFIVMAHGDDGVRWPQLCSSYRAYLWT
jgi:hypothetical protein